MGTRLSAVLRAALLLAVMVATSHPVVADEFTRIVAAGAIKVGVCLKNEPSGFRDSNGVPRGYDVDVATLMAEQLGVELELLEVSPASRVPDLLSGRIDVIACNITATPERARAIDFSFPYLRTGLKLLVRRDAGIGSIEDIDGRTRLVLGRDTTGEALARSRVPAALVTYAENAGDALLLLRQGQADVYIADSLTVDYMARANSDVLAASADRYTVDAIAFGIRKGNPGLLRWLDLFASVYVSSGKYAQNYGKWWGEPPPPLEAVW